MKAKFILAMIICTMGINAQHSGNYNASRETPYTNKTVNTIPTSISDEYEMTIKIKGIYNEKATYQRAVFSVLQIGKTADETNKLMDERIQNTIEKLKNFSNEIDVVVDFISFVPSYSFDIQKKIFNPKTYNEKPSGFELKKNIIVRYKNTNDLNKIISICAKEEIYDLAKVDYITTNTEIIRKTLQQKAVEEYKRLLAEYSFIMDTNLTKKQKRLTEAFETIYPMESYKAYSAYSQASINFTPNSQVNEIKKNETQFYDAALLKTHSFVVNPEITEPSIQLFYDLTIRIKLTEDQLPKNTIQVNNKYYLITPTGNIKPLIL
ncbi:MAG: SIMPL domain-containing protein [Limnohabitans sp.]|nr:SIMPL domain-containing protein [Limnohabitans sp.]